MDLQHRRCLTTQRRTRDRREKFKQSIATWNQTGDKYSTTLCSFQF